MVTNAKRWKVINTREAPDCKVRLQFISQNGVDIIKTEGLWSTTSVIIDWQRTLRLGEVNKIPIVLYHVTGINVPYIRICSPNTAYVTEPSFLISGVAKHVLSEARYEVLLEVYTGNSIWLKKKFDLKLPENQGRLDQFTLIKKED
jgi:hypothetical protein